MSLEITKIFDKFSCFCYYFFDSTQELYLDNTAKKSLQGRYSPTIRHKRLRKEYCYLCNRKVFSQVRFSFQKKVVRGSTGRVDVHIRISNPFFYSFLILS